MEHAGLRDLMLIALALCLSTLLVSTIYAGIIVPGSLRMTDTPGGEEMTQFPSGISVVYVVFDYSEMQNEEIMVRVYDNVGNVLFEQTKAYTESGTESVEVSLAGGGAFPDGRYLTSLYSGLFPISSFIWEVGGAPKIKTFLPCIVKQWPPSVTPTPTTTPSPTPGYDLYEPNNSFSTAWPINSSEKYFAYIDPGSDLDYFRFNIQNADYPITVWLMIPDPEKMLYGIDLYDADYSRIDMKANQAGENSISITYDPEETGRYYVRVYSIQNRFDPSQAYELRVVFDSAPTPTPTPTPGAGKWVIECVDCPKQFSNMTNRSLRLDAAGHPHIAYGGDHLYYAWHDGADWHYETVDDSPLVGSDASLALDGNGYPHISYFHSLGACPSGELRYAYQDATGWHITTVDPEIAGVHSSLALDSNGHPHISYLCGAYPTAGLRYAYQDVEGWHIQTVDSGMNVGSYTSLALDGAEHGHISYFDEGSGLKYAYQDASGWHTQIVDKEAWLGEYTSLALDRDGYPHISYHDWINQDLKYAYQDNSGWHIETADGAGGSHTSLALDESGYPHISYFDDTYDDLKYAYQDASGWHIETVDSEGDVGEHTSLALDGGYPHISYFDRGNNDLKYAYQDASAWHIETLDNGGNVGWYTSLALDERGYPNISYFDEINDDLKYTHQDASGWHIETVDNQDDVGYWTSLALDGGGYPHISYQGNHDLKYAYENASGWHIETVHSEGNVGQNTSLALDGGGYPHISYWGNSDLKYAYQDASGWHIETVDSEGIVPGEFSSLALDGGGYPHISYHDCNGDLKYAYYSAPWINWRDPGRPLLLPPHGATANVVYRTIATPATLTATLTGPALFAGGSQVLAADITNPNGTYALPLKPAAGATPGDTFTLEVTLDGLQLERVGTIAWEVYLPLIRKEAP